VLVNPFTMALWGLIVAGSLAIGFLLVFAGLAVVVPVLAHSTWHLYRKVVEPASQCDRIAAGGDLYTEILTVSPGTAMTSGVYGSFFSCTVGPCDRLGLPPFAFGSQPCARPGHRLAGWQERRFTF